MYAWHVGWEFKAFAMPLTTFSDFGGLGQSPYGGFESFRREKVTGVLPLPAGKLALKKWLLDVFSLRSCGVRPQLEWTAVC